MRIVAESKRFTIHGPIPPGFLKVLARISGRKIWSSSKYVQVEGSPWNKKLIDESGFEVKWEEANNDLQEMSDIANMQATPIPIKTKYHPKFRLKNHQREGLEISCSRHAFALFLEMGLGKTALAIANFSILYLEDKIEGVLILSPKGVHKQWVSEEIPKHIDPSIPLNMTLWTNGNVYKDDELRVSGALNIFSLNIDTVNTIAGKAAVRQFIRLFKNKLFMIVDESHQIGNYGSLRAKEVIAIGKNAAYRRILTGTPLATSLINFWPQFMFLDPRIIGIDYITPFKSRYCELNKNDEVVGSKNEEEFYSLIAPHTYRKTKKECLDLPDKIYAQRVYSLGNETSYHYENIKEAFMTDLKSGHIVAPKNALAALTRLQQILSGFLPDEGDQEGANRLYEIFSYERAQIALDMVHQIEGQVIIWARFIPDIRCIKHEFKRDYFGQISIMDDVNDWKAGKTKILLSNQARGIGGNLQESGCTSMIYYNNSFNLIHRLQSEDRIHRMGMKGALTIWDITADKTVDKAISENLKSKKDLSNFILDDIRQILE